jgi:hypothetical protein
MAQAHHWLDTPAIQQRITHREIAFIANVCRHWRKENKISEKQHLYVAAILNRCTKVL